MKLSSCNSFFNKTKYLLTQAELYAEHLVVTERGSRNIEVMTANFPEKEYHRIQHFISDSPWSARELIDSVAQDVNELFKNNSYFSKSENEFAFSNHK